jgi:hypothetical protein
VWLWVGIVPASLLFGRAFRAVSPARTIVLGLLRLMGSTDGRGLTTMPRWLGYWPAALGLFAFVWLELVAPNSTYLGPVRLWFACYFAIVVFGGIVFGERWLERADPFEVYSNLLARLSWWGRDDAGRLVWVSPLRNLAGLKPDVGLVAVVSVLLGSTAFDSWRESLTWIRFVQSSSIDSTLLATACLLGWVVVVGVVFSVAAVLTGVEDVPRRELPGRLAHSLVPIIVGYMIAHYLSYFFQVGQLTLVQMSDPLGRGDDLLGTGQLEPFTWFVYHQTALATMKVLAIVVGHVLGVISAHDRALELLPPRHQVMGQLGLLAAMVLFTYMGLYLLFGA